MEVHDGDAPRISPLPEDEWDDDLRVLIEQSWSTPPPGNRNNLFRTMARHRELFRTWSAFGRVVFNSMLPARDRQLLILRTSWLTQCRFEWAYHEGVSLNAGLTRDDLLRVLEGPDAPGWCEDDKILLRAVDELHATAGLSDTTWKRLSDRYDEQQLIEIPVIVGGYHLVAYVTNALHIAPDPELPRMPAV